MRALQAAVAVSIALLAAGSAAQPTAPSPGGSEARTLFIVLDAVPYGLLEELTDPALGDEAIFREFHRPVPLISTFPSTTSIALGAAFESMGLPPSPGYEARFFDHQRMKVRGGGVISYFNIDFPWRSFFDWSSKGVFKSAFAGLRASRASEKRMPRIVREFLASDDRLFFAYTETTDTAAHLNSPRALEAALRRLDKALVEARQRHPEDGFRVVIFSDHGIAGGEPLENVWPAIRRALKQDGLRYAKRLRRSNDVVFTPFGLVSSLEAYAFPEKLAAVSSLLSAIDGVALCAYRDAQALPGVDRWVVNGRGGEAVIERRSTARSTLWSYRPRSSDPLGYGNVLSKLQADAGAHSGDWFSDEAWFRASARHRLPDALHRIAGGFELVTNSASVLCSLEPGFMYGSNATERAARWTKGRLRWTHGALYWTASAGFMMSDDPAWRPDGPLRISNGLDHFLGAEAPRLAAQ